MEDNKNGSNLNVNKIEYFVIPNLLQLTLGITYN